MKPVNKKFLFAVLFLVVSLLTVHAQKKRDSIESQTVTVVKSYEPSIPDADKMDANLPVVSDEDFQKIPVEYNPLEIPVVSTYMAEKGKLIKPSVSLGRDLPAPGFAELAVGNIKGIKFSAHYLADLNNEWQAGGGINLLYSGKSVIDSLVINPYADFSIHGDVKGNFSNSKYSGQVAYTRKSSSYRDTLTPFSVLAQNFSYDFIGINNKMQWYDSPVKTAELQYGYLMGPGLGEHTVHFLLKPVFPVAGFAIESPVSVDLAAGDTDYANSYNLFHIQWTPHLRFEREKFLFLLGLKLYYQNRSDVYEAVQFFPDIRADYHMIPELLTVYLNYEGGLKNPSYARLLEETRYIIPAVSLTPTLMPYHFYGGFKGNIGGRVNYDLRLGMGYEKNAVFLNLYTSSGGIGLAPAYDNMEYFYFSPMVSYVVPGKFETKFNFQYYQFNPSVFTKAWNRPDYTLSWLLRFHAGKFLFQSETFYIGPRYYKRFSNILKAESFVDVNLKLAYTWDKKTSVFLEANNLLNRHYDLYYGYPVPGLRLMAGAHYNF